MTSRPMAPSDYPAPNSPASASPTQPATLPGVAAPVAANRTQTNEIVKLPPPRILITAGGTRVPVDAVRWVGNVGTGHFGARLAEAWLATGATVHLLRARDADVPYQRTIDLRQPLDLLWKRLQQESQSWQQGDWQHRFQEDVFVTFDEYAHQLHQLLTTQSFTVVMLTAAVSDYRTAPQAGKIRSDLPNWSLTLSPTPKLIQSVKDWAPGIYLVGFKLLAGSAESELLRTAMVAHTRNRADLTVANDLTSLQAGQHAIYLIRSFGPVEYYQTPQHNLAECLVASIQQDLQRRLLLVP